MWKDSIRNIVVIFQTTILRIVGFYVRRSANIDATVLVVATLHFLLRHLGPSAPRTVKENNHYIAPTVN